MSQFKDEETLVLIHRVSDEEYDRLYQDYEAKLETLDDDEIIPTFGDYLVNSFAEYDYGDEDDDAARYGNGFCTYDDVNRDRYADLEDVTAEDGTVYLMSVNELFRWASMYRPALPE